MRTVSMLCCLTWAAGLHADESRLNYWPAWRGPLANGTAPTADPPLKWDANSNIRWKAPLEGRGSATPIVWGDRVFVLTAIATDRPGEPPTADPRFEKKTDPPRNIHEFVVLCFDRSTGKRLWRRVAAERVPHEGHHSTHSYAAGSPTTDGQRLYVSFGSFGNYCYDLDGNLLWKRDIGRINSRYGWGEAVTPVLHGDSLILNWDQEADSALYCLDARTGTIRWKVDRDEKTSWNAPLIATHNGVAQVIVNGTNRIRAYDLKDGKELWQCGGMTVNAIPSIVSAGDIVYAASGYNGSAAMAIRLGGAGDLTGGDRVLWKYGRATPYVPSMLLLGDRLWFTQSNQAILTVLNAANGKPVIDRVRMPGQISFYASPVAAAGRVYFADRDGTTLVLKAGDHFEVLAMNKLGDPIDASPALAGKQIFLRGERFLYCIE